MLTSPFRAFGRYECSSHQLSSMPFQHRVTQFLMYQSTNGLSKFRLRSKPIRIHCLHWNIFFSRCFFDYSIRYTMFLEGCGGHQPARTRSNDQHWELLIICRMSCCYRWSTSPVTTTSSIIWRNGYIFNSNGYNLRIVGFLLSCIPLCEPDGHLPIIVISWIHIGFRYTICTN